MVKLLARYLKHFKKQVVFGPLCKLIEAIFELIVPLVMARIIDVGIATGDTAYILKMGALMVLLGILGLGFALICQYAASVASQGVGTQMRNDLFRHINSLSLKEIDTLGASSLVTRVTNDINQLQMAVAMLIRLVIRAPFLIIGAIGLSMLLDLKLSLVFLAAAPLVALVLYFVMNRSVPFYKNIQKKLDGIGQLTQENLEGIRVIRAFSKQNREKVRFDKACEDLTGLSIKVGKISALLNPLTYAIINLAIIAVLYFGGMRVNSGALTQGQIIAFVNYMSQILLAMVVVANLIVLFTKASAAASRVNQVFETRSTVTDHFADFFSNGTDSKKGPQIVFENVSFSYHSSSSIYAENQEAEKREYALENISACITKGECIGIIGGTGSGKSTFIHLLERFYDPDKGHIYIDGKDIRSYPLAQLREKIALVPQHSTLVSGTIRENLLWGNPEAGAAELREALETAQAWEFVEKLPQKYDTPILQAGKNLSGGQRQRLCIARALIRKPEILILDDSFSALDFATDAKLRKAIRQVADTCTLLLVSQRVGSIRAADRIFLFDDGKLAACGTHSQLIGESEIYREICVSQSIPITEEA